MPPNVEWQVNAYVLDAEEYRSYQVCDIDFVSGIAFLVLLV